MCFSFSVACLIIKYRYALLLFTSRFFRFAFFSLWQWERSRRSGREEEKCRNQFHHFCRVCSCLLSPSFLLSHSLASFLLGALFIGNHSLIIYHWKNTQRIFSPFGRRRKYFFVWGKIEDNFMPYPSLFRKIFAEFNQR